MGIGVKESCHDFTHVTSASSDECMSGRFQPLHSLRRLAFHNVKSHPASMELLAVGFNQLQGFPVPLNGIHLAAAAPPAYLHTHLHRHGAGAGPDIITHGLRADTQLIQ